MAQTQCCPICPRRLRSSSGLQSHQRHCDLYKKYRSAIGALRQQLELQVEATQALTDTDPDAAGTSLSLSPQREPVAGYNPPSPPPPSGCDVMVFPDTERPSQSHPSPTPPNPPLPPLPPRPSSPQLALSQSGRPLRIRRLPARYQDIYPEAPHPATSTPIPSHISVVPRVTLIVRNRFQTPPNTFGVWKEYLYRPSHDPDAFVSPEDLHRPHSSTIFLHEEGTEKEASVYSNKTSELLMNWQNSFSDKKSNEETTRLVHSVLFHPQFRLGDLEHFSATIENRRVDTAEEKGTFLKSFRCTSVDIDVPSGSTHMPSRKFSIPGLSYRQITSLIKDTFESPISKKFHLSPFKLFRKLPNCEDSERIYSEIYNSDVLLDEHDKVQRAPTNDPTCKREKVVAALMFWSDATHLATFGTAKMWPIYMLFGNLSKYIRCQPNSGATKHLAYIPQLPDSLQDELKSYHQKWETQRKDILTHCRRELIHAVWKFLLDDDFIHAHTYGMVVRSPDGIERRVYPRILTYSADYPEKSVFFFYLFLFCCSLPVLGCCLPLYAIRACVPVHDVWYLSKTWIVWATELMQRFGLTKHASIRTSRNW